MTSPARPLRILIVDAHGPTRLGLASLLEREAWVAGCRLTDSHRAAAQLIARHRPDLAVVDITEAGPLLPLLIASLRAPDPVLRLVFTARRPVPESPALRSSGATLIAPGRPAGEVIATIAAAGAGDRPAVPEQALALGAREREVLGLLVTGQTNKEIAQRMRLGPDMVKKYASSVYRKLGIRNRTEAAQLALYDRALFDEVVTAATE